MAKIRIAVDDKMVKGAFNKLISRFDARGQARILGRGATTLAALARRTTLFENKTGNLRRSIRKKTVGGRVFVRAFAPHASLVEFGHAILNSNKRVEGRFFLTKTAAENQEKILEAINRAFISEIGKGL